ncbi:hypothetical protein C8Q69DRAFT_170835 [Paecilomyces variotii]|uniref:Secreted protein n=1 Tax=Byssochlamys spectabilis TaxID=264951 RepID=A0A443I2X1_BYSSP|nr:hypothetical protein C8Q69DRAFT_170835 [Paecilomyces variotii]RWQ98423.1 hypothetical protein C8Q69DRAFT_170835 [Paecilomyces variotii]
MLTCHIWWGGWGAAGGLTPALVAGHRSKTADVRFPRPPDNNTKSADDRTLNLLLFSCIYHPPVSYGVCLLGRRISSSWCLRLPGWSKAIHGPHPQPQFRQTHR